MLRNRSMNGKAVKNYTMLVLLLVGLVLMAVIVSASRHEQYVFGQVLQETSSLSSVPPEVEWQKTFQEAGVSASWLTQTSDGGYAIVGNGNYKSLSPGSLVKLDSSGNMQWNKTYNKVNLVVFVQTNNDGYAILCWDSRGAVLVKTDSKGDVQWNQTYSNVYIDSIVQTKDGEYILAGYTVDGYLGYKEVKSDFWLTKVDSAGTLQWSQTYGGENSDTAHSLVQTSDGGYAIAGETNSYGAGSHDFWLVKTDANGNLQWTKTFGGLNDDEAKSVVQTDDGGYVLAGNTRSFGAGGSDAWLVKTDSLANLVWTRTYGEAGSVVTLNGEYVDFGSADDFLNSLIRTNDGGLAFVGATPYGAGDKFLVWLVKTDSAGNTQWNQTYSTGWDGMDMSWGGNALIETSDGAFAIAGFERVPSFPWLGSYYLIKTEQSSPLPSTSPSPGPVPVLEFPSTTISDNGSIDPPSAPIQRNGNVFTFTGDLKGTLIVNRDNIVIDGAGHSLQGNGTAGDLFIRVTQTGIDLTDRTNITVKNLQLYSYKDGIYLDGSTNTTISGNNITRNGYGIFETASTFTTISENNITMNEAGIFVNTLSSNNNVTLNNIVENSDTGIVLNYTVGNVIFGNNISYNGNGAGVGMSGIDISFGSNNLIAGNILYSNLYGIFMAGSGSIIAGNDITRCSIGVTAGDISDNVFYMNNFNNTLINHVRGEGSNSWDNGTVGNYWGDYLTRYPDAKEIDGSGIGDTPYVMVEMYGHIGSPPTLNINDMDRYPLMAPISNAETSALAQALVLAHSWSPTSSPSGLLFGADLVLFASLALAVIVIVVVVFVVLRRRKKQT